MFFGYWFVHIFHSHIVWASYLLWRLLEAAAAAVMTTDSEADSEMNSEMNLTENLTVNSMMNLTMIFLIALDFIIHHREWEFLAVFITAYKSLLWEGIT